MVSVSRAGQRERLEVYLRTLRERLPRVTIPLRAPDQDVGLDLQGVFERCYEYGAYEDLVDYRANPEVPLPPEDAAWVDEHLRRQGLRP